LEAGQVPQIWQPDPYWFAMLRANTDEVILIATLALHDRRLLVANGETLQSVQGAAWYTRRPIERNIVQHFEAPSPASSALKSYECRRACIAIEAELREQRLLPSAGQQWVRLLLGLGASAFLWWVSFAKVSLAFSRGHHNVGFLIFLSFLVPVAAGFVLWRRRTTLGNRVVQDFQSLFSGLRERAAYIAPGGATNELSLLLGIYGVVALEGAAREQFAALYPAPPPSSWASGGSSGSSCGSSVSVSSCGSSSSGGSSCGSSCGGGGGGCGGCGS
jgi:uncharacterized protein (TIGR04222 family)